MHTYTQEKYNSKYNNKLETIAGPSIRFIIIKNWGEPMRPSWGDAPWPVGGIDAPALKYSSQFIRPIICGRHRIIYYPSRRTECHALPYLSSQQPIRDTRES